MAKTSTVQGVVPVYPPNNSGKVGNGFDDFTETITLSGTQYVLSFSWMSRMSAWYVDIAATDGTKLVTGRRVSPKYAPWGGLQIDGMPPGQIFPDGPDPYNENDLGQTVITYYLTVSGTRDTNPYGVRVVLS